MPFDAMAVSALKDELQRALVNGRVEKIYQPQKDLLIFSVYHPFPRRELLFLISTHPRYTRCHILTEKPDNPPQPPAFCMLLRKYLQGGRILLVDQPPWERLLTLRIENFDPERGLIAFSLIFEAMGRFSNLILLDDQDVIIDALKRFPEPAKGAREIFPGRRYETPPVPTRFHPGNLTLTDLQIMIDRSPAGRPLQRILTEELLGLSTPLSLEIMHRAGVGRGETAGGIKPETVESLYGEVKSFQDRIAGARFSAYIYLDESGEPVDFFPYLPRHLERERLKETSGISRAIELTVNRRQLEADANRRQEWLKKAVREAKKKLLRKKEKQLAELKNTEDADLYRLYGELLTANQYRIPKGLDRIELSNYYDPEGKSVTISLDPSLTANENAQNYFKKFSKAKKGKSRITEQLNKTEEALEYLDTVESFLQDGLAPAELREVEEEMQEAGLIKKTKKARPGSSSTVSRPKSYRSTTGREILVGRNNKQNDLLTMKLAGPRDLWFHTQKIPGSHVVVRSQGRPVDEITLLEAANLAVHFSKARNSTKVPVDYTEKRYVRKPPGATPGFVLYDNFQTIIIDPDPKVLERLEVGGREDEV